MMTPSAALARANDWSDSVDPCVRRPARPIGASSNARLRSKARSAAARTASVAAVISGPMPSPAMTTRRMAEFERSIGMVRRFLGFASRPHAGRLDRHAARALHQKQLERDVVRRAEVEGFGPHAGDAVAHPPLLRADALPLEPIDRIPGRMRLWHDVAGELLAPVVVVALRAGHVDLPLPQLVQRAALRDERREPRVDRLRDRQAARLAADESGERQQLVALELQRRRILPVTALEIDALLEVDRAAKALVERRIARGHALHALRRVAVAIGAGFVGAARLGVPERLAVEHPERRRIGRVVVLHGLAVAAEVFVAGAALVERDLGGEEGRAECEQQKRRVGKGAKRRAHAADTAVGTLRFAHPTGPCLFHSTVIFAEPVSWKPLSPVHSNSIVPLSVATVWKLTNGLAAIAGNRSVRKISSPL